MRKKITTINEAAREVLNITRDEYALCSYVQYRQADRRGKAGWCTDKKEEIAAFVGITPRGLYKMVHRLCGELLLIQEAKTGWLQVLERWIDTENGVNLVPVSSELSSDAIGTKFRSHRNLVPIHNKVEYDKEERVRVSESEKHAPAEKIKITLIEETLFDLEQRSVRESNEVFAAIQNSPSLKTEIEKALSPSAAPPPFPETPTIFETWLKSLTNDPRMREGFTITQKIPSSFFEDYVTRFTALARTQPGKYVRPHDLTGHFLNWSGVQYRNNHGAPNQSGANTTTTRGAIPQNVKRYGS